MTYTIEILKSLDKAERKAWNAKMRGSDADACTFRGKEGKNEIAWRDAAFECSKARKALGLIGRRGY